MLAIFVFMLISYSAQLSFGTPVEYELFDIDKDPYQLKNLYSAATADQKLVQFIYDEIIA